MSNYFDEYDMLRKDMAKLVRDIVAERERQGVSQGRLAEMAGIKQSAISRIENLSALPQLDTLLKILRPLSLKLVVEQFNVEENNMKSIPVSDIKMLDVEVLSCNLIISKSEDENAYFMSEEEDEFIIDTKGDTLELRQKRNIKPFFGRQIDAELKVPAFGGNATITNKNGSTAVVSLPFVKLSIESDNGKISLEGVDAKEFSGLADNGKVEIEKSTGINFEIKTDNGKIVLKDTKIEEGLICETDNGKILLDEVNANRYGLKCKNGKIQAKIDAPETDFSMEISNKIGSATVGGKKYHGSYIYKDKDRARYLSAHTKNGVISIVFSDTDQSYRENFKQEKKNHESAISVDIEQIIRDGYNDAIEGLSDLPYTIHKIVKNVKRDAKGVRRSGKVIVGDGRRKVIVTKGGRVIVHSDNHDHDLEDFNDDLEDFNEDLEDFNEDLEDFNEDLEDFNEDLEDFNEDDED